MYHTSHFHSHNPGGHIIWSCCYVYSRPVEKVVHGDERCDIIGDDEDVDLGLKRPATLLLEIIKTVLILMV